jgi:dephospho-CoA kinase
MGKNKGIIFGISGKLGSGKDTFAEFLAEELPNRVERHAMADNLRLITEIITGVDMCITHEYGKPFINQIHNYTQEQKNIFLPKFNKTIGETLQLVGTDLLRERYDNDIWVKSLFSDTLNNKVKEGKIIIVPDVRFLNEANYIVDNGGILIRLEGDPKDIRRNSSRNLNHISETELDDYNRFHKVIKNDNGLEGLRKKVMELITEFNF